MAEKTAPRVTRLLGIVTTLERHGELTVEELAERFGVSAAQIKKDVETLWVSGLPGYAPDELLDFDAWAFEEGIVRLTNSQGLSQVKLSAREAVALIGALSAVITAGAAPAAAASALSKLGEALGDGEILRTVPSGRVSSDITYTLTHAIEEQVQVLVTYVDALDRKSERIVDPHGIVIIDGAAYLECYCHRAQDFRTLKLERITAVSATTAPVEVKAIPTEGFHLEQHFEAVVQAGRDARWVFEAIPGVSITTSDDGAAIEARFGVAQAQVLAAHLLSAGPYLRSIAPPEFADEVKRQARLVLDAQA